MKPCGSFAVPNHISWYDSGLGVIGFDGLYFEKRATRGKYAVPPYQRIYQYVQTKLLHAQRSFHRSR